MYTWALAAAAVVGWFVGPMLGGGSPGLPTLPAIVVAAVLAAVLGLLNAADRRARSDARRRYGRSINRRAA